MAGNYHDIPTFVARALHCVGTAATNVRLGETKSTRVLRRFNAQEVCDMLGCNRSFFHKLMKHPEAPVSEDKKFSVADMMKLRALSDSRPTSRKSLMHWRKPGEKLPVISVSSQKGGTGKSVTAAHLSQYLTLFYGLRVGVIDADPQATCSLYFVDGETAIAGHDVESFTDFMGVPDPGETARIEHDPERLNSFWKHTPWPGLRLIPGGASIQEADIAMYFLTQSNNAKQKRVYRLLRDTLRRWEEHHQPTLQADDFSDADGNFRDDVYQQALYQSLDVVIIDTAPNLSLAQLNAVVAADMLVIPQTMKGFDLSTLEIYLSSLGDYFQLILRDRDALEFAASKSFILPTIVSHNDTDLRTIGEIFAIDQDVISPVYYRHSDGVSNAFREYKSAYEYQPGRARRASMQQFVVNANAVNDAIVTRALPHLPSRGFANQFIRETYPEGAIPMWSAETGPIDLRDDEEHEDLERGQAQADEESIEETAA